MLTIPHPLSDEQIAEYYREGYTLASGLVPTSSIDAMLAHVPEPDPSSRGGTWMPMVFQHDDPMRDAELHRLLVEPSVFGAAEQIFEAPAHVYYGMVAIVPPGGGSGLPWHQDNQYSLILPSALNIFIACCDISLEMAMLWVAPRSHLLGRQPSREAGGRFGAHRTAVVEPENGIRLAAMKKGDAVIFDRNTYHRSLTNESERPRYAYAAQYQAAYSRPADTGRKDTTRMPARDLHQRFQALPELSTT